MKDISIRYAAADDYQKVEEIAQEVQNIHCNLRPDVYRNTDTVLEKDRYIQLINYKYIIIAEINGKICGYSIFVTKTSVNPLLRRRKILYIDTMAVKESCRHTGVGSSMFSFIKEYAKQNIYDSIEMTVVAQNYNAVDAYKKWGFDNKSINMDMRAK